MLNNLKPTEGSRKEKTRRCRGLGQLPLFRAIPKRGFKNHGHKEYAIVNVSLFNRFNDGDEIDLTKLVSMGLVNKEFDGLKVLGEGELTKKVSITATKFSKSALEKIEKCR